MEKRGKKEGKGKGIIQSFILLRFEFMSFMNYWLISLLIFLIVYCLIDRCYFGCHILCMGLMFLYYLGKGFFSSTLKEQLFFFFEKIFVKSYEYFFFLLFFLKIIFILCRFSCLCLKLFVI